MTRPFAVSDPSLRLIVALLILLTGVNGLALWGIVTARRDAQRLARQDLRLQVEAQGSALEAALATLRGDLLYLSQAPPVSRAPLLFGAADPVTRRWGRLDVEGAVLLFLDAHPPVERIFVRGPEAEDLVAAGRRSGAAVLLREDELRQRAPPGLVRSRWPLGVAPQGGSLEVFLDPGRLLAAAAPAPPGALRLETERLPPGSTAVHAAVRDPRWSPPLEWTLIREEDAGRTLRSFELLAGRYQTTVLLNVLLAGLSLLLGFIAVRQVRRSVRLEAETRHQARLRELERQVEHNERLASLGRLAAGFAHEINNPLEGMSNYLRLLRESLEEAPVGAAPPAPPAPHPAQALAGRVEEGLDRVAAIVRQVLTFADPGQAPKARFDARDPLRRTVEFVTANPAFRGIDVRLIVASQPLPVLARPTALDQLFLNLVLNACQVQGEKGEVEIAARAVAGRAIVTVEDRGPGLSPETLGRLYDPFFSTRGSAGLGLTVCHGIVRDEGGRLIAENRRGGGARFTVELPLTDQGSEPRTPEADAEGAADLKGAGPPPRPAAPVAGSPATAFGSREADE